MENYELPLVFFTVFCQWGVGGTLALTLLRLSSNTLLSTEQYRRLAILFCAVTLVGSLSSVAHLGAPVGAYRALAGVGSSWLSREVIAVIALNALLVVWAGLCWFRVQSPLIHWVGVIGSLTGLLAIFITSQVYYQLLAHPLWHSAATPLGFLGTACLAGFISVLIACRYWHKSVPLVIKTGSVIGLALIGTSLLLRYRLAGADATSLLLWWQLGASGLLASWVLAKYSTCSPSWISAWCALVLIVSGELAGRMLFYSNVMSGYPWF